MLSRIALVLVAAALVPQSKPDVTGKWTVVPDKNAAPAGAPSQLTTGGWGNNFAISETPTTLVVTRPIQGEDTPTAYTLDGVERKSQTSTFTGQPVAVVQKAKRQGDKIVVEESSTTDVMGNKITLGIKIVLSLAKDGTLVMETTRSGGALSRPPLTTKYSRVDR